MLTYILLKLKCAHGHYGKAVLSEASFNLMHVTSSGRWCICFIISLNIASAGWEETAKLAYSATHDVYFAPVVSSYSTPATSSPAARHATCAAAMPINSALLPEETYWLSLSNKISQGNSSRKSLLTDKCRIHGITIMHASFFINARRYLWKIFGRRNKDERPSDSRISAKIISNSVKLS